MAFSSLPGPSRSLYGAVQGRCSHRPTPWRPSFGFFGGLPAVLSRGRRPFIASGVGLGGGYCTPPNRTRRERSELVFRGVWGEPPNGKVIHKPPCVLLKQVLKEC